MLMNRHWLYSVCTSSLSTTNLNFVLLYHGTFTYSPNGVQLHNKTRRHSPINTMIPSKHFFINPTDAHNYKITGMLKHLKFPQLPHPCLLIDFWIIFKQVWGSTLSTMTSIYPWRFSGQILVEAIELSLLQNIQTSSSAHPASNSMKTTAFSLAVKWPVQTLWPLTSV